MKVTIESHSIDELLDGQPIRVETVELEAKPLAPKTRAATKRPRPAPTETADPAASEPETTDDSEEVTDAD